VPFLQLTIELGERDPQPVEDALFEFGALSVTLEDAADDPVLEPAPGAMPLWPTVRIRALFDAGTDVAALGSALVGHVDERQSMRFGTLADKVWEREWLKDFRPMRFGRRLWVCPGGLAAGDADAIRVELDPGLAFGTGTHPTTALCLEWLESAAVDGLDVVDYGCGSGILATAAAKLGAATVRAVDLDPQALIATDANARRNGVRERLRIEIDVLVANILAGPLVALAPSFAAALRRGGRVALSGILDEQSDTVTAAYRPWFDIAPTATRDGWALLAGRRRAD
jgi:ribosomal protein L11 methyltransferase